MIMIEIGETKHRLNYNMCTRNRNFLLLCFFVCQFICSHTPYTSNTTGVVYQTIEKSAIEILHPNKSTVWTISEPASIAWKTSNIDSKKSIRFFLARDDMVVQELGTFKNTFTADGINLAKNISSGDTYQVVGIELFPDNKYQVAKFATPYFSIRNEEGDARRNASKYGNGQQNIAEIAEPPHRQSFEGRKISYTKELVFEDEKISIDIWDHGRQDNDIVSIYLNGETIISKHLLTYRKKHITIRLDPSKSNDLFLYAHNLGKVPPNTVSIKITDGKTTEDIVLNSDLKSCEAVLIKIKK
ncbi:hypothetical protein SAMN04488514_108190 [Kriegella aquimaris]|uniref:Uncharacterized protein n=1 Tax=Kriegella aquimaris TaxID=192904 RepID=A0A1G9T3P9_9FLAO|nr:hypothetical protein SAMN04488514_108190 [Kriegella aquimaris]